MYQLIGLRVKTSLLGPEERKAIIAVMKASEPRHAKVWAMQFKRLPNTIRKIAAEENITLR
jgi:hypothetical protein